MTTIKYTIPAIHCGHCTHTIEVELADLEGIRSVKADQAAKNVEITFEPPATEDKIKALLNEINYPVAGLMAL